MKDLIVIIIAIALSAITAISAMYYGGAGFMNNEASASASQIVNYLNNYVAAVNTWAQRNGGFPQVSANFPITADVGSWAFSKTAVDGFLSPRYIQTNSMPSKLLFNSANPVFYYDDPTLMQNPVVIGLLGPSDQKICNAIETMRTTVAPNLRTFTINAAQMNHLFCGNFGCLINNGDWGSASTYAYVVYSRVGGRPNVNNPDVNPTTCN